MEPAGGAESVAVGSTSDGFSVQAIAKTYPGTRALGGVSFEVSPGTVHALVGGNGSGKSTLIKVLAGVVSADPGGTIRVRHTHVSTEQMSPGLAHALGLRFVHQHSTAFADCSVAENLALGSGFAGSSGHIDWAEQRRHAAEVLERFHVDVHPDTPLYRLGPASQTMVAIARALQDQEDASHGILILDEPTATLAAAESELLLRTLRRYADDGRSILFVSHRLREIEMVADRATVFRDGLVRTQLERADLNEENLVEALVGRRATEVARSFADAGNIEERVVLSVSDMRGGPIAGVTLNVRRGEVVGVAGRQGSGRTSLLEMLFGRHKPESGSIALDGERVTFRSPSDAIREGISYVPADRASSASFAGLSIVENYSIARLRHYWRRLVLRPSAELADAESARARYRLKASRLRDPISTLSGGNQQKVILARWLESRPRLVLLDEPTQGIDVGARADIYALVRGDVTQFAGVLLVSSDFEELCLVCDRVVVLEQGKITAEFNRDQLDPEALERAVLMQEATP